VSIGDDDGEPDSVTVGGVRYVADPRLPAGSAMLHYVTDDACEVCTLRGEDGCPVPAHRCDGSLTGWLGVWCPPCPSPGQGLWTDARPSFTREDLEEFIERGRRS
jgi:hypothetical protein